MHIFDHLSVSFLSMFFSVLHFRSKLEFVGIHLNKASSFFGAVAHEHVVSVLNCVLELLIFLEARNVRLCVTLSSWFSPLGESVEDFALVFDNSNLRPDELVGHLFESSVDMFSNFN